MKMQIILGKSLVGGGANINIENMACTNIEDCTVNVEFWRKEQCEGTIEKMRTVPVDKIETNIEDLT